MAKVTTPEVLTRGSFDPFGRNSSKAAAVQQQQQHQQQQQQQQRGFGPGDALMLGL